MSSLCVALVLLGIAPSVFASPESMVLQDVPQPLHPLKTRTPEEQDRLEAVSLFAAARIHQQREDNAAALRLYQRAYRYDPAAKPIIQEIVNLAEELDRLEEAIRYADKLDVATLGEDADPAVFRKLGIHLTEKGLWAEAAAMYEKAVAARKNVRKNAADVLLQMELGRLCHLAGRHAQAADCFARVLAALEEPRKHELDQDIIKVLLGEPGVTYEILGDSFLESGRLPEAAAMFEKSQQAQADQGRYLYNMARVDFRSGKPQEALDRLQRYFDALLAGEGMAPYELLGQVLAKLDKGADFLSRLEKLKAADAENIPLGYFLAEEYRRRGKLDQAEPLLRRLVAKAPTLTGFRALVQIYTKTRRADELQEVLAAALAKTAGLESLDEDGKTLVGDKEMVGLLFEAARKRAKAAPPSMDYEHWTALLALAREAKQPEAAAEFLEHAIRARPAEKANLLLSHGLEFLIDQKYAECEQVLQRVVDEKAVPKDSPSFHYFLAAALEMQGKTDAAVAAAREALSRQPDSPRLAARVGWVLYHAKRRDEAVHVYQDLIERFGGQYDSEEIREIIRESRLVLSNIAVDAGRTAESEEYLEAILDEYPDDPSASNDLGFLWADANKNLQRSLRMVRIAVEAEPDNAAYLDSLGWVLFRLGQFDEAVKQLEKATADEPDPTVLEHLGDAYKSAGKAEKAKDVWKRAAEEYRKAGSEEKAKRVQAKALEGR